jgi:hypothetical protein
MREQLEAQLRASEIARRRTEEEGAEAFFPSRATRRRRTPSAMREQLRSTARPKQHLILVKGLSCCLDSRVASTVWR